jgi:hypothetical protein
MKPEKEFDCVEMKAEIQARLLREIAELGEEEAQRRRAERLSRDPILGSFLRTKSTTGKGTQATEDRRQKTEVGRNTRHTGF